MNITKFIPAKVTTKFARQILIAKKNSPHVLFGIGIASGVASTVLACRSTLKLEDVLHENERLEGRALEALNLKVEGYTVKDYNKDLAVIKTKTVLNLVKLYGPAIGLGAVSISCLTGAHVVLNKRNVALATAYTALDKGFKEYRNRVENQLGTETELELRHGTEEIEVDGKKKTVVSGAAGKSIYARFFDELTKNWQPEAEYNRVFIQAQQNYANDLLRARGHLFLNEVYDMLGIERSQAGAVVGWLLNDGHTPGDNYVDFGIFENNPAARDFLNGREASVLLDFNVDGTIYDKI